MPVSSQTDDLRAILMRYVGRILNRQPYFSSQIRQKLSKKLLQITGQSQTSIIDEIIDDLKKAKYLNDDYLLEGYINNKLQKLQGPKIITFKLKQLGIKSAQVQDMLNKDEVKKNIDIAVKKLKQKYQNLDEYKINSKLYQRGFKV